MGAFDDLRKKRTTAWPWVLGLVLVAIIGLGITVLLATDEDEGPVITVPTVEDTLPPAPIPTPPEATGATDTGIDDVDISRLDEDRLGERISVAGEVVATGNRGYWILAGDRVLRVESARRVRRGESVSVRGTLRTGDPERAARIESEVLSRHPDGDGWRVLRTLKLLEDDAGDGAEGREA